jgi:hypothetical protein
MENNKWISVDDRYPDITSPPEDFLITYEYEGKVIVEIGYMCGENLIKGQRERYPYPQYWMPLPKSPLEL